MLDSMTFVAAAAPPQPWSLLLGRLHVVVVHFPIALLWMAVVAELVRIARRREERSSTAFACLSIGTLSALVAAGLGWLHAYAEPLDGSVERTLFLHRWTGVATAGAAVLTWILAAARQGRAYRVALLATAAIVTAAGNFGGELVYGEDYLRGPLRSLVAPARAPSSDPSNATTATPDEPGSPVSTTPGTETTATPGTGAADTSATGDAEPETAVSTNAPTAARSVSFAAEIEPLLAERCYRCHGAKRQRGDLRLDDLAAHFARDPSEWVIRPGDAEASELHRRITLPADDEDVMPASGDPLTPDEIALLGAWIDQGARYE